MATTSAGAGGGGQGRRRPRHQGAARRYRVEFSLSGEEFAVVRAAAQDAGLARGAFAAQAVVAAAAGGESAGEQTALRQALAELIRASGLVRRIGVNLNQAVAKLNATGQHAGDLPAYAAEGMRRAGRLDDAAEQVRRALR